MKAIIFLALIGASVAQICPPPEVLSPCTCSETKRSIECKSIRGRFNLKGIFDNASSFVNDDVIFDSLSLFDTPLVEIPADSIQSLKFTEVEISFNQNLVYVSPNAFNASRKVTKELDMWNNRIDNVPPYERDIYDFIRNFENLESVWIPSNALTLVPDNAFANMNSLDQIYLGSNGISHIGSNAFAGAPKLRTLWMSHNSVPSEGLTADAFSGISELVGIDLTYNNMDYMDQQSFQHVLDRVATLQVGGTSCGRNGCTSRRLYCDERADWICDNVEFYRNKLSGFLCYSGTNVWDYCGNRTLHQ